MKSKIFFLLMLVTPGILGIPTPPMDTDDSNVELSMSNDVLPANESSVDSDLIANGVSKN